MDLTVTVDSKQRREVFRYVLSEWLDIARREVAYYENGYFPELAEHTGFSQSARLQMAKEQFDRRKVDIQDFAHYIEQGHTEIPFESRADLISALRHVMREEYRTAVDWIHNPWIVGSRLRFCVTAKHMLQEIDDRYEIYSTKWLCRN